MRAQGISVGDLGPQLEATVVCCTVSVGVWRIEIDGTEVLWEADWEIENNGLVRWLEFETVFTGVGEIENNTAANKMRS